MTGRSSALILGLLVCGCADEQLELLPINYESDRARLGVDGLYDPLCEADLAGIDARVRLVEERLGVRRDEPVELYLMRSPAELPCADNLIGCYYPEEDQAFAIPQTLHHEIVHAVTRSIEFPSLFWREGTAEVLSEKGTRRDPFVSLAPEDLEAQELDNYLSAGHFSRFLVETRGWESFGRVIRGEPIDVVYGQSAASLTEEYEATAPLAYPPLEPCPFTAMPQVEDGVWRDAFTVSCSAPGATQFEGSTYSVDSGVAIVRTVELEAGTYALELEGGPAFLALACHTDEVAEEPMPPSNGDLNNEFESIAGARFPAVGTQLLELTAGTYRFTFPTGPLDEVEAEFEIRRVE